MGTITTNDHSKPLRQLTSTALKAEFARYMVRESFSCAFDGEYGLVIAVLYPAMAKQVGERIVFYRVVAAAMADKTCCTEPRSCGGLLLGYCIESA
ncbi:MAG: hypothetical protein WBD31_08195 [Rubripirellula sp.]